jgi:hypothetical protein
MLKAVLTVDKGRPNAEEQMRRMCHSAAACTNVFLPPASRAGMNRAQPGGHRHSAEARAYLSTVSCSTLKITSPTAITR